MPQFPNQFAIIGDPNLKDSTLVSINNSNDIRSKKTGSTVAGITNQGTFNAYLTGDPVSNIDYSFRIQDQGGLGESTYAWKVKGSSDSTYKGELPKYLHSFDNVHAEGELSSTDFFNVNSVSLEYTERKEFVFFTKENEHRIFISYRDFTERGEGSWTVTSVNLASQGRGIDSKIFNLSTCILKDGTILIGVIYNDDIDLYRLVIDGTNLSTVLYSSNLLTVLGDKYPPNCIKLVSSGNYVNVFFSINYGEFINSIFNLYSADAGVSWSTRWSSLNNQSFVPTSWDGLTPAAEDGFDQIWSAGALDDEGTVILLNRGDSISFTAYVANGSSEFFVNSSLSIIPAKNITRVEIVKTSNEIIFLSTRAKEINPSIYPSPPASNGYTYFYPVATVEYEYRSLKRGSGVYSGSQTLSKTVITSFEGSGFLYAHHLSARENGSSGISLAAAYMTKATTRVFGIAYSRIQGWDTRPPKDINYFNFPEPEQYETNLQNTPTDGAGVDQAFNNPIYANSVYSNEQTLPPYYIGWSTACGLPTGGYLSAGTGSVNDTSLWRVFRHRSTVNWTPERLRITDRTGATGTQSLLYRFLDRDSWYSDLGMLPALREAVAAATAITNYGQGNYSTSAKIPQTSFAFIANPRSYTTITEEYVSDPVAIIKSSGSCIRFVMKVGDTAIASGQNSNICVGLSTYMVAAASASGTTQRINLEVRVGKDSVHLYDVIGSSSLTNISPNTGTYGSDPFTTNYWEFRLGIYPYNMNGATAMLPSDTGTYNPVISLMCRRVDSDTWLDVHSTSYTRESNWTGGSISETFNQMIYFGHKEGQVTEHQSFWKSVGIHAGNDWNNLRNIAPDIDPVKNLTYIDSLRGRSTHSSPKKISDDLSIVWGGSGAAIGDTFEAEVDHTFKPSNMLRFESPRIKFMSVDTISSSTLDLVFQAPNDKSFYHDALAVFGSSFKTLDISYSNDSTSFSGTTFSLDLKTEYVGKVTAVDNNILTVEWDSPTIYNKIRPNQFTSSSKRSWYLKTTESQTSSGTTLFNGPVYLIDRTRKIGSNQSEILINTENIPSFFPIGGADAVAAGLTITIYSDRGLVGYSSNQKGKYVRFKFTPFSYGARPYVKCGSIVAGTTFTFDVPLNWEWSDDEKANQNVYNSRSGINWSYEAGPPRRTLSLNMIGDIKEFQRESFRNIARGISSYSKNPMVLVTYPENSPISAEGDRYESIALVNYSDSTDFKNQGWYYDPDLQIWNTIGNMSFKFTEII